MGVVRSLLGENTRYLIELRVVRSLLVEWRGIHIELGVVRRMLGENRRYLIELRAVRSLLGEWRGIR